jgi:hypothetical protein
MSSHVQRDIRRTDSGSRADTKLAFIARATKAHRKGVVRLATTLAPLSRSRSQVIPDKTRKVSKARVSMKSLKCSL